MRLWSLHPKYLDRKGLLALWREGLLAQKVLAGKTKGYKNHPQLIRFKNSNNPLGLIGLYLLEVAKEAKKRGYSFDTSKIQQICKKTKQRLPVTRGQVVYEFELLCCKLKKRDKRKYEQNKNKKHIETNKIFRVVPGDVEKWERLASPTLFN